MNDIDDDRDELAFAKLDPADYLNMPCWWSSPCAEAVRDDPTRSTPASTRWCAVRSARHRARWRSKRSRRECSAAGTRAFISAQKAEKKTRRVPNKKLRPDIVFKRSTCKDTELSTSSSVKS